VNLQVFIGPDDVSGGPFEISEGNLFRAGIGFYRDNEHVSWEFSAFSNAYKISLEFERLDIEPGFDFVEVYTKSDFTSTWYLQTRLSGGAISGTVLEVPGQNVCVLLGLKKFCSRGWIVCVEFDRFYFNHFFDF
jgi:hypothetical protein